MISLIACAALSQLQFQSINRQLPPKAGNDFWFVALGDNRPAGAGLPPTRTFRQLLDEVGIIGPSFVISSGDLLYGNEETLAQYRQEIAWMRPVIDTLPCPFYNAPGNHEINNRPEFLKAYTEAFGAPFGSFDCGQFRFVAVCTEIPAEKPSVFEPQLSWLKKTLGAHRPAVVFQHHPVFPRKTNDEKASAAVANAAELHEIYREGGVKLVVEGHDHVFDGQSHDGVEYRIAGGAGAPLDGVPTDGGYFHFMLAHVHDGDLTTEVIPSGTLEILPISDGIVAAANYAYADLPVANLRVVTSFKPKAATADVTSKKGKKKEIPVKVISMRKIGDRYETRLALILTRARATYVRLKR
ncbi:MAG: metallophosphoesterase [Fimbriimonas sp.]|nr:metallophosphoesterase [Fimbriimonas sp.]